MIVNVPEELPTIELDEEKMRDVLINLLMNAIKFTPDKGEIRLEVGTRDDHVELTVIHSGIGIVERDQPHIFKEFFTSLDINHPSSGEYGYQRRVIGLELAVVKKFTDLHVGGVEMQSRSGHGSRFFARLPLTHPTLKPQQSQTTGRTEV